MPPYLVAYATVGKGEGSQEGKAVGGDGALVLREQDYQN